MCFQWSSEFSQPARCDYQRSDNWSSRPASVIDSDIDARQRLGDQSWSVDCGRARDVAAAGRRPAVTSPASSTQLPTAVAFRRQCARIRDFNTPRRLCVMSLHSVRLSVCLSVTVCSITSGTRSRTCMVTWQLKMNKFE